LQCGPVSEFRRHASGNVTSRKDKRETAVFDQLRDWRDNLPAEIPQIRVQSLAAQQSGSLVAGEKKHRLQNFVEQVAYGETLGRTAFAFGPSNLPEPNANMEWKPVAPFSPPTS